LADTTKRHLYVNDVSDLLVAVYVNEIINYTVESWVVGASSTGTFKFNGAIAELWFNMGQYLDFSVEANRRKFISATGKPVNLGSDGSTPTGVAPIVYQRINGGDAAAGFATNLGTGGNFSVVGSLDIASTSPSD